MQNSTSLEDPQPQPRWRPLTALQRRILGVLIEKAKTTPAAYPLTLNAITTGCRQKSNRAPQMAPEPDDVEETLEALREMGAVGEIVGSGRASKYRHYLYQWLGVEKVELAVMAELLLRGHQTIGELRGRAARMEPIADLPALKPVLDGLIEKNLVVSLTPEGRGQVVTHNLYLPEEMASLKRQHTGAATAAPPPTVSAAPPRSDSTPAPAPAAGASSSDEVSQLRQEVAQLRDQVAKLRKDVDDLWSNLT